MEVEYCWGIEVVIEVGIDYFDMVLEYGNGYCEQVVGKVLQRYLFVVIFSKIFF